MISVKWNIECSKKIKLIFKTSVGEKDDRISPFRMTEYEYVNLIGKNQIKLVMEHLYIRNIKGKSTGYSRLLEWNLMTEMFFFSKN